MTTVHACSCAPTLIFAKRAVRQAIIPAMRKRKRKSTMLDRPAIQMRLANEGDLPGILALYAQPEIDNGDVLSNDDAQEIFARFANYPDYVLYVAEQNGVIVGSFALLI